MSFDARLYVFKRKIPLRTSRGANNRPFARWRHFTTTTRILQDFAFLCKLGLLFSKPHWEYQIRIWKKKRKRILVVVVKWRHHANGLLGKKDTSLKGLLSNYWRRLNYVLHNSSHPTKAEFNNCFIIHSKYWNKLTSSYTFWLASVLHSFRI